MTLKQRKSSRSLSLPVIVAVGGALLTVVAGAYYLFSKDQKTNLSDAAKQKRSQKNVDLLYQGLKRSNRQIAVVLTQELVARGVPISSLLFRYPNLVFLMAPDLYQQNNNPTNQDIDFYDQIPPLDLTIESQLVDFCNHMVESLKTGAIHLPKDSKLDLRKTSDSQLFDIYYQKTRSRFLNTTECISISHLLKHLRPQRVLIPSTIYNELAILNNPKRARPACSYNLETGEVKVLDTCGLETFVEDIQILPVPLNFDSDDESELCLDKIQQIFGQLLAGRSKKR